MRTVSRKAAFAKFSPRPIARRGRQVVAVVAVVAVQALLAAQVALPTAQACMPTRFRSVVLAKRQKPRAPAPEAGSGRGLPYGSPGLFVPAFLCRSVFASSTDTASALLAPHPDFLKMDSDHD